MGREREERERGEERSFHIGWIIYIVEASDKESV